MKQDCRSNVCSLVVVVLFAAGSWAEMAAAGNSGVHCAGIMDPGMPGEDLTARLQGRVADGGPVSSVLLNRADGEVLGSGDGRIHIIASLSVPSVKNGNRVAIQAVVKALEDRKSTRLNSSHTT